MQPKKDVLFICIHNSARSQMAEAYLEKLSDGEFTAESAGFEPGTINPLVVEAMKEEGIDLSGKKTQSVFELFKRGNTYRAVVTVCDESQEGKCPIFPGLTHRLHLPFTDPSTLTGTHDEKLEAVRAIRDEIKRDMGELVKWLRSDDKGPMSRRWQRLDLIRS